MNSRSSLALALVSTLTLVGVSACARDLDTLGPAPFPTDAAVFLDGFGSGVQFQAFLGTNQAGGDPESFVLDESDTFSGSTSIRIKVPTPGDPAGSFAGGVLATSVPRDLTGYDALTFWAKASTNVSLDVIGLGNDNTGTSRFPAERTGIQLSTSWQKIIMPIPLASRLEMEGGLFTFADGADAGNGYTIWFDELQFEDTGLIANTRPSIPTQTFSGSVGSELAITGTQVILDVNGTDVTISAAPAYFTYASSDQTVATVDEDGNIAIVGDGTAVVTASLGSVAAAGEITVTTDTGGTEPATPAPTPTVDPLNVVSMFSNAYTDVPVDTWSAGFDQADLEDIQIAGDDVKKYTNLVFAAAEATTTPIDASAMTRFHMDIWTPDATAAPAAFRVKLVDFGADGGFMGGDDSEHELTFNDASTPPLATGTWVSIDVPMTDFAGLAAQAHIAQLIISGDPNTVFVDNVYFYNDAGGGGGGAPVVAAPTPTVDPLNVISMFSNAYTDVPVDTWSFPFDQADVEDVQVAGDDVKKYTNLVFAVAEAATTPIDATTMTRFHMDIWTPDATAAPAVFKVKLVDFGADGGFAGGDDSEHEITFNDASTPPLATGAWVSIDVPMTDFAGLAAQAHIAQLIISGDPNTVFVDNVYFYTDAGGGGGGTGGDGATGGPFAVSFDDPGITYTLTDFGGTSSALEPDPADAGNTVARTTKLATAMTWAGTTVGGTNITYPLSATETQISMRVRSPDAGIPVRMKVETAGDPTRSVETEAVTTVANAWETLTFDFANEAAGTAPLNPAYTYDMLSVFFNFGTDGATAGEKTYYWDTIEFLGTGGGGGGGAPVVAAPTPTQAAGDVVSMFSNAYTDVAVDTWSAGFDQADLEDIQIAGDDVKKYTNLVFAAAEATTTPIDASAMTHFHMDIWTPDATAAPAAFRVKLVDFGADGAFMGGDDSEHELTFNDASTPPLATGAWVSIDVPMTDFAGLTAQAHIAQLIISGDPNTVFVDNVYFYK